MEHENPHLIPGSERKKREGGRERETKREKERQEIQGGRERQRESETQQRREREIERERCTQGERDGERQRGRDTDRERRMERKREWGGREKITNLMLLLSHLKHYSTVGMYVCFFVHLKSHSQHPITKKQFISLNRGR